jgi:hypothetical protein
MMDEDEFARVYATYLDGIRTIQAIRERDDVSLAESPVREMAARVRREYEALGGTPGFGDPGDDVHHVLKHRLADYGPLCTACGRPLRTPEASLCAACGHQR